MFDHLLGWYTIYTFSGALASAVGEFCHVQNSLCVQVLRSPILAALLHGTPAAGVSQSLRHGTRNGITKLSQRAPLIFGWAAIALGIGSHSSSFLVSGQLSRQIINAYQRWRRDRQILVLLTALSWMPLPAELRISRELSRGEVSLSADHVRFLF